MKQLYQTLKIFLGCSIGVFLGSCIYQYYHFRTHPALYAMHSAPWYVRLEVQGLYTVVLAVILLSAMRCIRQKLDQKG